MRIAFFSTIGRHQWGGSEELWSRAARSLLERGHDVAFNTSKWGSMAAPLRKLIDAGARPCFRGRIRLGRTLREGLEKIQLVGLRFAGWLRNTKPDLVVISLSSHMDDPLIASTCQRLGIPYALLLQAAGPNHWLGSRAVPKFREAYRHAWQVYFVSAENRETMESNLGIDLSGSPILDNPFTVRPNVTPAWPTSEPYWKLAMVGRIHFASKSQDLVVRVLRQPKWRSRPLKVTFWGNDDGSLAQLRQLIELYSLDGKVTYGGFCNDIESVWADHHGLLLPSRVEGNALALIEAMLCGRVPIVTDVGRASELIDDNESGFIAPAATSALLDQVLERAWQRRHAWQAMGERAANTIRERHSLTPGEDFAERIINLAVDHGKRYAKAA